MVCMCVCVYNDTSGENIEFTVQATCTRITRICHTEYGRKKRNNTTSVHTLRRTRRDHNQKTSSKVGGGRLLSAHT